MLESADFSIAGKRFRVERQQRILDWLAATGHGHGLTLAPASADASFRRYFRVTFADGNTAIVMDAPPSHEDTSPWLHVQALFGAAGVRVPAVLAENRAEGFLLIGDLGSTTYLSVLNDDNADRLYRAAIDSLVAIQAASQPGQLPDYDRALLQRELDLFPQWYLDRHLGMTLAEGERQALADCFEAILAVNLAEPRVFVHRDYHSRNLMLCEPGPGIIDFQDAVFGPISYDLVSLFKDAYIAWDEARTLDWLIRYWQAARRAGLPISDDFALFHRDYEWMGVQRHLKVLGIFARLCHRDGKTAYLKDMPLVSGYLRSTCERYRELKPILALLDRADQRQVETGLTF
jgi:aminoglycoside/choline kinase family phosphotransferase